MQYYTIAIVGGGGLWVTGVWENIVRHVKKGQKLAGCGKRGANKSFSDGEQAPINVHVS